jgi:hypothetical protein
MKMFRFLNFCLNLMINGEKLGRLIKHPCKIFYLMVNIYDIFFLFINKFQLPQLLGAGMQDRGERQFPGLTDALLQVPQLL